MVLKMNRGINLGNVLSAPIEGNWQDAVEKSYFEDVASVGFKTVRIPADFFGVRTSGDTSGYSKDANTENLYSGSSSDYIVDSSYLDRMEEVLTWSLNENLVTILDLHGADIKDEFIHTYSTKDQYAAYYTNPTSAKRAADYEKFKSIWTQIANRFKNYSYDLVFEIINEPYFHLSESEMNQLNTDIIAIIRNSGGNNATRNIVIITGGGENSFNAPLQISDLILESDSYLIPTFHYYLPRSFTASAGENHTDFDWGTAADKASIDTDFGVVKTWATEKSVSILLGEFGADNEGGYSYDTKKYGDFGGPENDSRVEFHKYLSQKAIDLGYSLTVWDSGEKSNKSIYLASQDVRWVTEVRNTVLGIGCLDTEIISNVDVECGVGTDWSLYVDATTMATIYHSSISNAYTGVKAVEINVSTAGVSINKVILKNQLVTDSELSEKTITLKTFAKATNISGVQNFKFRLKITNTNDVVSYASSGKINLTSAYQSYDFETVLPTAVKSVEFHILCGEAVGTYYFDDFMSLINDRLVIGFGTDSKKKTLVLFPNPVKDGLNFSFKAFLVAVFNSNGQKLFMQRDTKSIEVSSLKTGTYFVMLTDNKGIDSKRHL